MISSRAVSVSRFARIARAVTTQTSRCAARNHSTAPTPTSTRSPSAQDQHAASSASYPEHAEIQHVDRTGTALMRLMRSNTEMRNALEAVEQRIKELGHSSALTNQILDFEQVSQLTASDDELRDRMRQLSVLLCEFQVVSQRGQQGRQQKNEVGESDCSRSLSSASRPLFVSQGGRIAQIVQISTPPHERQASVAFADEASRKAAEEALRQRILTKQEYVALPVWKKLIRRLSAMFGLRS